MNKMKDVAKLYNKELGEVFPVLYYGNLIGCEFTEDGLFTKVYGDDTWCSNKPLLSCILTGEAVPVDYY